MRTSSSLVAAFLLAAASAAPAATVTTVKFCTDSSDGSNYQNNRAASGWTFSSPGADAGNGADNYTYPVRFNQGTRGTSATTDAGSYMTKLVLGVRVTQTTRAFTVSPVLEDSSSGTSQTVTPESTSLEEISFSFSANDKVVSVVVSNPTGSGNAYLYYATITTETSGGGSGPTPLSAPTFEPVHPEDATADGFVLRWLPIEGAVAYELSVTNAATGMGVGATVTFSIPSGPDPDYVVATVSDLESDTTYAVAARALATTDPSFPSTDYTDSDWSSPVTIQTTLADGLARATLLDEGFSGNTGTWGGQAFLSSEGEVAASRTDVDTWYGNNLYNAPSALRFGNATKKGWVRSPAIALSNDVASASVTVAFNAIALHANAASSLVFSILDADGEELSIAGVSPSTLTLPVVSSPTAGSTVEAELAGAGGSTQTFTFTAPNGFRLKFDTSASANGNVAIDDVIVTQVYDPNYAVLATPTGVEESDVGKYGFTVSWTGVEHAEGYEVWLDGAVAGSCASTDTSMELTGLSDGTTYSVQVKALGDNLHVGDSLLSTAISVTTLADAQKIDFTVTGAPTGDVFAGDAVAFTVTAENEATHAAEPVSFSGIADATFTAATGAFSWTPMESDVGSHTATFTSGDYSTNVAITVVSALKTETLFHETFEDCNKKWIGTSTAMTGSLADEDDWTFSNHCYSGESGLRIGLKESPNYGSATTRAILPKAAPGTVRLSFRAAGNEAGSTMTVTAAGGASFSQTVTLAAFPADDAPIPDTPGYVFGPYDIAVSDDFTLSFAPASGDGRMGVDEILVTQTVSARVRDLAAPTGLAVVGEPGENGFTVAWTAVADATNYVVRVTDASGAVVFSAPFCAATSAAVTGLADDEAYNVQVRATGDEAVWFASPWSTAVNIRTERSALHPTLTLGPWTNVAGETDPVATLANTAPVAAALDGGEGAVVEYVSIFPEPDSAPTFADGTLSWTPAETDAEKSFTLTFTMAADEEGAPVYTTNVAVSVDRLAATDAPVVTVANVAWNSFELRWEDQYRASDYRVRVWTGTSDPDATDTEYSEHFEGFPSVKPDGWTFENGDEAYPNNGYEKTRLAFKADGSVTSPELSGSVTDISFEIRVDSGSVSVLTVQGWTGTDWVAITNFTGETLTTEKKTIAGLAGAYSRFRWTYAKNGAKNCGLGSIVFSGTGLPTARFLPGWETPGKSIGKETSITVAKPVPGRFTGRVQNPQTGKWEDTGTACVNYAEVTVVGTDGKTVSTVVAVPVPYLPGSVRATLLIFR